MIIRHHTVRFSVLVLAALSASSCVTQRLWELTDSKPVVFSQNEMTEREIREKGLTYTKDDKAGLYYVEKTDGQRAVDYGVRLFATPATLCLDAVTLVPVLAVLGVQELAESGDVIQSGGKTRVERESRPTGH